MRKFIKTVFLLAMVCVVLWGGVKLLKVGYRFFQEMM